MPITSLSRVGQPGPDSVGSPQVIDGSLTGDDLASTGVTPGSYTNANITVDEDGRLTTASNGSATGITFNEDKSSDSTITGAINGINTAFILSFAPISSKLVFCVNGITQESVTHYTLVGTTLTLTTAPTTGDDLTAFYVT